MLLSEMLDGDVVAEVRILSRLTAGTPTIIYGPKESNTAGLIKCLTEHCNPTGIACSISGIFDFPTAEKVPTEQWHGYFVSITKDNEPLVERPGLKGLLHIVLCECSWKVLPTPPPPKKLPRGITGMFIRTGERKDHTPYIKLLGSILPTVGKCDRILIGNEWKAKMENNR